ncbi:MAG: hypothetical protein JRN42_06990, partial [Nitrososphaerota archaeon]|nr:hypothetical protein [Nitrososphaerota archaeon]
MREILPRTADDYIRAMNQRRRTAGRVSREAQLRSYQRQVFDSAGEVKKQGWAKVGQQFVGPILLRLKYEGMVRDMLLERPLAQGKAPYYPVQKDVGCAYVLQGQTGELKIHRVENNLVLVDLLRIGSRPLTPRAEVLLMDFDVLEHMRENAYLQILEQEDGYFLNMTESVITSWEAQNPTISHTVVNSNSGLWGQTAIHTAFKLTSRQRLKAATMLMEVGGFYDMFNWTTEQIGWKAREELTEAGAFPVYGGVRVKPSVKVAIGSAYVAPDPKYVGFMPIRWSLRSEPVEIQETAEMGFVLDELVGFGM